MNLQDAECLLSFPNLQEDSEKKLFLINTIRNVFKTGLNGNMGFIERDVYSYVVFLYIYWLI